jgi:hypothetical protein
MSDRLCGVVEGVEPLPETKRVLAARAAAVRAVADGAACWPAAEPFGPSDLCYTVKTWRGAGWTSRAHRQGFYHHLSGANVTIDGCAAYFGRMTAMAEPAGFVKAMAGEWTVEEATFCFYAAFSQADIRLTVRLPPAAAAARLAAAAVGGGGSSSAVTQLVVTKAGTAMGCPPALWREARFCAGLRALGVSGLAAAAGERPGLLAAELAVLPRCLAAFVPPAMRSAEGEEEFLQLAVEFYGRRPPAVDTLGGRRWAQAGPGGDTGAVLADALFSFFADRSRFADGAAFFTQLAAAGHASAWLGLAGFLQRMGQAADAAAALLQAERCCVPAGQSTGSAQPQTEPEPKLAQTKPEIEVSQSAMIPELDDGQMAAVLRAAALLHGVDGELQEALERAVRAVTAQPDVAEGWLLLVRLLMAGEQYALALLALNAYGQITEPRLLPVVSPAVLSVTAAAAAGGKPGINLAPDHLAVAAAAGATGATGTPSGPWASEPEPELPVYLASDSHLQMLERYTEPSDGSFPRDDCRAAELRTVAEEAVSKVRGGRDAIFPRAGLVYTKNPYREGTRPCGMTLPAPPS